MSQHCNSLTLTCTQILNIVFGIGMVLSTANTYAEGIDKDLQIDSLLAVLKTTSVDTVKLEVHAELGELLYGESSSSAISNWKSAINLGQELIEKNENKDYYRSKLAHIYNSYGNVLSDYGENREALVPYKEALRIFYDLEDTTLKARVHSNIGYTHLWLSENPQALENYFHCLKLSRSQNNERGICVAYHNVGIVYHEEMDYEKALQYYLKSLAIEEKLAGDDMGGIAESYSTIGIVYHNLHQYDTALTYYFKGLDLDIKADNKEGMASSLNNIGSLYIFIYEDNSDSTFLEMKYFGKYGIHSKSDLMDSARSFHAQSIVLLEGSHNRYTELFSIYGLASVHFNLKEYQSAIDLLDKAMEIAVDYEAINEQRMVTEMIYLSFKNMNKFEEAYEHFGLFMTLKDSIVNDDNKRSIIKQETQYEFEKAQLVKEQKKKERMRIASEVTSRRDNLQYSVIFITILTLFGGVLFLGFINVSERMAEGIIFFSFLILFEFLLVLADPYIEEWSGGAPGIKLLFNAGIAALIFPAHAFFESKLKRKLVKQ